MMATAEEMGLKISSTDCSRPVHLDSFELGNIPLLSHKKYSTIIAFLLMTISSQVKIARTAAPIMI